MRYVLCMIALLTGISVAWAHSWYDSECCSGYDCALVTHIEYLPDNSWKVTTQHGTAIFPPNWPRRASQDGRMHACFTPTKLYCLYVGTDT